MNIEEEEKDEENEEERIYIHVWHILIIIKCILQQKTFKSNIPVCFEYKGAGNKGKFLQAISHMRP